MIELNKVHQGDCMELMKQLPDESIDCVIVDPPYGTVKGMRLEGQKGDPYEWDSVLDMDVLFKEYFRTLKPKGKVFVFSQNGFTQQIRGLSSTYVDYLYPMIWKKNNYANYLSINKAPVQMFEDISVFEKIYGLMPKSRAYADKICDYIGLPKSEIFKKTGSRRADHFLRTNSLQFSNISEEGYRELIECFHINLMEGFLNYSQWLRLYNEEKDENRAKTAFTLPDGKKHFSNILDFPKDYPSRHPTQKPVALIEQIIKVYTEKDAVILDNCIGSGTTAVAALNTGRYFIGMEQEEKYVDIANERIKQSQITLELV